MDASDYKDGTEAAREREQAREDERFAAHVAKLKAGDRVTSDLHPGTLGAVRYVNPDGDAYVEWRSAGTLAFGWCDAKLLAVWSQPRPRPL